MQPDGFQLLPWQQRALSVPLDVDVLLAGGRGGGKTDAILAFVLQFVTLVAAARVLIVRRTHKAMEEILSRSLSLFTQADAGARYSSQMSQWRFSGGQTVELGYLDCEADFTRYQGRGYGCICVDEAGQYQDPRWLDLLRSCLRSPPDQPVRMILSANPAGVGHGWIFRRYVAKATPWVPYTDEVTGRQTVVCPSTFADNHHLDGPAYERQLKAATAGDPELARAWIAGDWFVAKGAYFSSVLDEVRNLVEPWDRLPGYSSEIEGATEAQRRMIAGNREALGLGRTLPRWRYFLAHDYGCSAPSCTYLMAESPGAEGPDGRWYPRGSLVAVDELATVADPEDLNRGTGWTVPRLAEEIRRFCARWDVPASGIADDAIFSNHGSGSGTIAHEFARLGVHWSRAHKSDRRSGWEVMRRLLSQAGQPDVPGLYISRRCWYAWQTLPYLARDPRDADDLDSRGPDHAADCLRYACLNAQEFSTGVGVFKLPRVH